MFDRPPLLEERFAQTLLGKRKTMSSPHMQRFPKRCSSHRGSSPSQVPARFDQVPARFQQDSSKVPARFQQKLHQGSRFHQVQADRSSEALARLQQHPATFQQTSSRGRKFQQGSNKAPAGSSEVRLQQGKVSPGSCRVPAMFQQGSSKVTARF